MSVSDHLHCHRLMAVCLASRFLPFFVMICLLQLRHLLLADLLLVDHPLPPTSLPVSFLVAYLPLTVLLVRLLDHRPLLIVVVSFRCASCLTGPTAHDTHYPVESQGLAGDDAPPGQWADLWLADCALRMAWTEARLRGGHMSLKRTGRC
jgi:hypothetical protein